MSVVLGDTDSSRRTVVADDSSSRTVVPDDSSSRTVVADESNTTDDDLLSLKELESNIPIPQTLEELHIFRILAQDINCDSKEDEKCRSRSASFFFKELETTTSVQEPVNESENAQSRIHVKINRPKGCQTSLTTLDYFVLDDEKFYEEKVVPQVNLLYQRINHDQEAVLKPELILAGNVAVAWNEETKQYCRVRILTDFVSMKKKTVCKLLDEFGEIRVAPYLLFVLVGYYGKFPPKTRQIRLEHLRFYDNCVSLKTLLMKRLSKKCIYKTRQNFCIELTGSVDEAGIALGYLTDGIGNESINRSIMNDLLFIYQENNLFSEIGDTVQNLSVSHMLPTGHTFLQNRLAPTYKHLEFLLSLFPSRKGVLVPVKKKEDVNVENFYLTLDGNGQLSRVEVIPPQVVCEEYDYDNGVCVDFSDRGLRPPKPVPVADLYLAEDLDPILQYLPRQCYVVKLFKVQPIPLSRIHIARSLFPTDDLFSAVAADKEGENESELFHVELYNEKTSKIYRREITHDDQNMSVYIRNSVNAEFLKIFSSEKRLPISFTTLKPSNATTGRITYNPFNPNFSAGPKIIDVYVDSVYSYDDMNIICKKDLGKRRKTDKFLTEYMKTSKEREWTEVTEMYVEDHPDAMYVVPWDNDGNLWCRATVIKGRLKPEQLKYEKDVPLIQVLLLDYVLLRIVAIPEMHFLCVPKYVNMPPLAAVAQFSKRNWEVKKKKTFNDFKALSGTVISITVQNYDFDSLNRMWLKATIVDKKKD